jgi:hypothetical protein
MEGKDETSSTDDIDITPEMVKAATEFLWASGLRNDWSPSDSFIVKEMLVVALKARPKIPRT